MQYVILKIIFQMGREQKYKVDLQNGEKLKSQAEDYRKKVTDRFKNKSKFSKTFVKHEFLVMV